ncbi:BCCT family transporter [Thiotrichales bacterium 19S3-7]|nr:BCCT family transporter [Thiotrichales bacterium 19S3-7]MCF6801969.1 BCCT family transporter [Thiotrichales bacterium 19S3-11]
MNTKLKGIYAPVFFPSIAIVIFLTLIGIIFPNKSNLVFANIQVWLTSNLGWLYVVGMAVFLCVCIFLMVSRLGDIKLGSDHDQPEHHNLSWFAMLFAAGMGIGLMFFSVAEPLKHYLAPPNNIESEVDKAKEAMNITFFHWGLEAWGVYAIVGLSLAYFAYRHKLPLLPRSALYPIFGRKIFGLVGHLIDIFAIIGTIFGIATSLGLGASQVNAGLNSIFQVPDNISMQVIIIVIVTLVATGSVALGLQKGIKLLSNINLTIAIALLLFILTVGSTAHLLQSYVQNIGVYLSTIVHKTFNLYAYQHKQGWLSGWTLFYWGWWIAWSPFVGMFIAKVSKGRTIREFLIGVLFIPVGFTFLWMTVFGNLSIDIIQTTVAGNLIQAVENNVPKALFVFFQYFPFSLVTSLIAMILVIIFFVTSADSGALVIDIIATGNADQSVLWQRVCWSLLEGFLAISLLYSGGLIALQTATIVSAFPFLIILLLMCIALVKALREDFLKTSSIKTHKTVIQFDHANVSWQNRLDELLKTPNYQQAKAFLFEIVQPAMKEFLSQFQQHHLNASLVTKSDTIILTIPKKDGDNFTYSVRLRSFLLPGFLEKEAVDSHYYRAEVFLEHGGQHYDIMYYSKIQVISDIVTQYEKHLYYLHVHTWEDKYLY